MAPRTKRGFYSLPGTEPVPVPVRYRFWYRFQVPVFPVENCIWKPVPKFLKRIKIIFFSFKTSGTGSEIAVFNGKTGTWTVPEPVPDRYRYLAQGTLNVCIAKPRPHARTRTDDDQNTTQNRKSPRPVTRKKNDPAIWHKVFHHFDQHLSFCLFFSRDMGGGWFTILINIGTSACKQKGVSRSVSLVFAIFLDCFNGIEKMPLLGRERRPRGLQNSLFFFLMGILLIPLEKSGFCLQKPNFCYVQTGHAWRVPEKTPILRFR